MPDIESLMQEWPLEFVDALKDVSNQQYFLIIIMHD